MIVAVASCPNPPLLLPGITGRPVTEVEELRAACFHAVQALVAVRPEEILVIGGQDGHEIDQPLSITIGRRILAELGCTLPVENVVVAAASGTAECLHRGRGLAARVRGSALVVMADGSARRTVKAPGYFDVRAVPYDEDIGVALASGDPNGLAALDPTLGAELLVAGRAAWQVLAGATEGRRWLADLRYAADPFGVWYPVATWMPLA